MSTKSWREYLEIGGFAAIVASLLLLGYELRQNTLAVQATALQQHFEQHTGLVMAPVENADLRASLAAGAAGLDSLSDEHAGLFFPYWSSVIRNHFVAFELRRTGLLPDSQWRTFQEAFRRALRRNSGARQIWEMRRTEYPEEFRSMVDELIVRAETGD